MPWNNAKVLLQCYLLAYYMMRIWKQMCVCLLPNMTLLVVTCIFHFILTEDVRDE